MSNAKSPYAYPEVRAILDLALEYGGIRHTPRDSYGNASERAVHTFVARANNVRNNLRKIDEAGPYERLILLKRGEQVVIEVKPSMLPGDLLTLEGTLISVEEVAPITTLSAEERAFLEELEQEMKNG